MLERSKQAGDTLIEVLLAIAIFSAVVIGAIVIMNQGIASAQNALEINLVRNQIDTQAELLRHLNGAKLTSIGRNATAESREWDRLTDLSRQGGQQAQDYGLIGVFDCDGVANCRTNSSEIRPCHPDSLPANAFFIDPKDGAVSGRDRIAPATTFAQVQTGSTMPTSLSNMIWIQGVPGSNDSLGLTHYYDFHVRACWDSPGAGGGLMKLGTIVRLYVPN